MLWNIIDNRKRPYRWREVNAIVEPTARDNSCKDADQAPGSDAMAALDCEARKGVSVARAVEWAQSQPYPVTLYLYDLGHGCSSDE